jgi:MoCo/4Fe-4S cofactor protein with predicted Tat translocation signal
MDAIRQKLEAAGGKEYWRGLDELAETEDFKQWLDDEFPHRASLPDVDRRSFLKLMGASLALAGLVGCRRIPPQMIVPHARESEERIPGTAKFFATTMPFAGYGFGVLVESYEGRPIKIEGNPNHPSSLGSTDVFAQAELLTMYDPDRSQSVLNRGLVSTYEEFLRAFRTYVAQGQNIRILTETVASPSLAAELNAFINETPGAQWHQWDPAHSDGELIGVSAAAGQAGKPIYDLSNARVVLSLDADFLATNPHNVRYARQFVGTRDPERGAGMGRLYSIESTPGITGAYADHRLPVRPSHVAAIAQAILSALQGGGMTLPQGVSAPWLQALVNDLRQGPGVVIAGDHQAPEVHEAAWRINQLLGAEGTRVRLAPRADANPQPKMASIQALARDMRAGQVDVLVVLGGNPVYNAPADLGFAEAMRALPHSIHIGMYANETAAVSEWHVPEAHWLETWGDAYAIDGTPSLMQPLIEPLYGGRSLLELVSALRGQSRLGLEIVRETWGGVLGDDLAWQRALERGVIQDAPPPAPTPAGFIAAAQPAASPITQGYEALLVPDPTIWDGRYSNNGWLQELPKPITKLTWDNAVLMSPRTAIDLNVDTDEKVRVTANNASVEAPVFIVPGHPDGTVTLHMGYGRTAGGRVASDGVGFNFHVLRGSQTGAFFPVQIERIGGRHQLASAQLHHSMEGRDIIREGSLDHYQHDPHLLPHHHHEMEPAILYNLTEEWAKSGLPQWGMTIDLNVCVGCNACVTACQAENNIPTVGKTEVARGREMHWIRVDRYYRVTDPEHDRDIRTDINRIDGNPKADQDALDPARVTTVFQPMPCMHCETAPCEPVCPVAATVHSHEGLNQMVYNRCVGTRYCSNNCPYKVRRFNYLNYQFMQKNFGDTPQLRLLNNPEVTVRSRGVMEKCTYCVQRINKARVQAKKDGREIMDGEVIPACAQACPTQAIQFGNVADPQSLVSRIKQNPRNYALLDDHLNTRPRTTFLGKVRNLNPEMRA